MQSRGMSAVEAASNVAVGWLVAIGTQLVLFPVVGLQATLSQNVIISFVFSCVSLLRSYALRRFFEVLARPDGRVRPDGREATHGTALQDPDR